MKKKSLFKDIPKETIDAWKKNAKERKATRILVFYNFITEKYYCSYLLSKQKKKEVIKNLVGGEVSDIFIGMISIKKDLIVEKAKGFLNSLKSKIKKKASP
jgi:hypothetical protein